MKFYEIVVIAPFYLIEKNAFLSLQQDWDRRKNLENVNRTKMVERMWVLCRDVLKTSYAICVT